MLVKLRNLQLQVLSLLWFVMTEKSATYSVMMPISCLQMHRQPMCMVNVCITSVAPTNQVALMS